MNSVQARPSSYRLTRRVDRIGLDGRGAWPSGRPRNLDRPAVAQALLSSGELRRVVASGCPSSVVEAVPPTDRTRRSGADSVQGTIAPVVGSRAPGRCRYGPMALQRTRSIIADLRYPDRHHHQRVRPHRHQRPRGASRSSMRLQYPIVPPRPRSRSGHAPTPLTPVQLEGEPLRWYAPYRPERIMADLLLQGTTEQVGPFHSGGPHLHHATAGGQHRLVGHAQQALRDAPPPHAGARRRHSSGGLHRLRRLWFDL